MGIHPQKMKLLGRLPEGAKAQLVFFGIAAAEWSAGQVDAHQHGIWGSDLAPRVETSTTRRADFDDCAHGARRQEAE
jgi:hypothetical protein